MGYRAGDVVNGYRLNDSATGWDPVDYRPAGARRRRVPTIVTLLAVLPAALFVALMQLGMLLAVAGVGSTPPEASAAEVTTHVLGATPIPPPAPTPTPPPDTDGDGVKDDVDAYPADPARSSLDDRDGDGTPNATDVAPDDPDAWQWATGIANHVVDGDTIDVDGIGRIRLIGVDTPERGECGYQEAADLMSALVLGKEVTLVPGARDDKDRYDRLLRYVEVDGADAGREEISAGLGAARYDSRDGYGTHPREADYVARDSQVPDKACPAPVPAPAPSPAPAQAVVPVPARPLAPAPAAAPWNVPGPDLDCADIRKKVRISPPDYHSLDRDGDGWGCESHG